MVLLQQQQVEEADEGDGCNCFDGILEHNDKLYPKREREDDGQSGAGGIMRALAGAAPHCHQP
jgi:hypothetical protein